MTPTPTRFDVLLEGVPGAVLRGDGAAVIQEVVADNRAARHGALFVAVRGTRVDGHKFVASAASAGASAVIVEDEAYAPTAVPWALVPDSRQALARCASRLAGSPSASIPVVGITGTNGKTTTSYILEAILSADGQGSPLVIGTVSFRQGEWQVDATHTTPDALSLARLMAGRLRLGATHVVLEVSSHGLDQRRADGVHFDVAVFTNLTREHLEYHADMLGYFDAKARLFRELLPDMGKGPRLAVIGVDDPWGQRLADEVASLAGGVLTFSAQTRQADIWVVNSTVDLGGIQATVNTPSGAVEVRSRLVGQHNLLNLLAAVGASVGLGVPVDQISEGIRGLESIPGRLEAVGRGPVKVFVDYAHSPDALAHVAGELKRLSVGRLITVFGCAGDRDAGKRPLMAQAAYEASDLAVVTSDNPRTEDPETIVEAVCAGMPPEATRLTGGADLAGAGAGSYLAEVDRARAIGLAIGAARPHDTVLIAGKGHETYQIVGTVKRDFDDRHTARLALAAAGHRGEV